MARLHVSILQLLMTDPRSYPLLTPPRLPRRSLTVTQRPFTPVTKGRPMARASLAAVSLGIAVFVGCGNSEIVGLRAAVEKHKRTAESAAAATKVAEAAALKAREAAAATLAKAEELQRQAIARDFAAEERARTAATTEQSAEQTMREANDLMAAARVIMAELEADRIDLNRRVAEAQQLIADGARAKIEAKNAEAISAGVQRLAAAARDDRQAAEQALLEVARTRQLILAERLAATREQKAACASIEAARLEKLAAADALEAAKLAKQEIVNDRSLLDQEREVLAEARQNVEERTALADARLAKAEAKKASAELARTEAARQQVILAEQLAALEAAKEAAAISALSAEQSRALSAIERRAAEKARATAAAAQQEVVSSNDYVSSVLAQLRETQEKATLETTERPRSSVKISAGETEDATK